MGVLGAEILELRVPLKPFLYKIGENLNRSCLEDAILKEKESLLKLMSYLLLLDVGAAFKRNLLRILSFSLSEIYNFFTILPSAQSIKEERKGFLKFLPSSSPKVKLRMDPLFPSIRGGKEIIVPYNPKDFPRLERVKSSKKKKELFKILSSSQIFWFDGIPDLVNTASLRSPFISSRYRVLLPRKSKVKEVEEKVRKALKKLGINLRFEEVDYPKVSKKQVSPLSPLSKGEERKISRWIKKLRKSYGIDVKDFGGRVSEILISTKTYGRLVASPLSILELCYGICFLKGLINREVGWILRDRLFGDLYLLREGKSGRNTLERILSKEILLFKKALEEGWEFAVRSKKGGGELIFEDEIIAHSAYLYVISEVSGFKESVEIFEKALKTCGRRNKEIFSSYVNFFRECTKIFEKFS